LKLTVVQVVVVVPRSTHGFSLSVNYSQRAISEAEVSIVLDHFEAALLFLTQHPRSAVGDVILINEQERQHLVASNYPRNPISQAQNISELIEGQARRTPHKIAVCVFFIYRWCVAALTTYM
jgi:non-ribosomal peptide synthetase component F